MTEQMDDVDRLQASLNEALGADALETLSSVQPDRPMFGIATLAAFGAFLLAQFAWAYVEEVKKRLTGDTKALAAWLADQTVDRLEKAVKSLKPLKSESPAARKAAVGTADKALRSAYANARAASDDAVSVAKAKVVAELKKHGFSQKEADAKAETLARTIMASARKGAA